MRPSRIVLSALFYAVLSVLPAQAKDACYSRYDKEADPAADATFDKGTSAFSQGDHAAAVAAWASLAETGDCRAQYNVGTAYLAGSGRPKDISVALAWFRKAAEQGNAKAQYNLAEGYRAGEGIEKDLGQAIAWHLKAADQGMTRSHAMLGLIYDKSPDVPRDIEKAVRFYRQAAAQGEAGSCLNLGVMHALGEGVERDKVLAHFFVGIAAAAHFPAAEVTLPKIRAKMSVQQIEEAEGLARNWTPATALPDRSRTGRF
ncbi:sel1 repeat family protein [Massilia sp. Dwa41.01b]|uniref:tetratricopeptide repeat protein n=1 Tax=unclassified Massilia TaxID=2609279 RepID=UPI0016002338|nr:MULTISPECIES: tetratricopeptide repeat protein [unclassified Massilia]QNA89192.1 sel1 repeat family protein [Massilia sp. Dwa41.01b]QNB00093.1 sel1 repeat family protein [Massilia sp. Se16.2.3]